MMKEVINSQSSVGFYLLQRNWDFTGVDFSREEYARAMKLAFDAADAIGAVEHTNDWDPWLQIVLMDDTIIETDSHYYQFEIEGSELVFGMDEDKTLVISMYDIKTVEVFGT